MDASLQGYLGMGDQSTDLSTGRCLDPPPEAQQTPKVFLSVYIYSYFLIGTDIELI